MKFSRALGRELDMEKEIKSIHYQELLTIMAEHRTQEKAITRRELKQLMRIDDRTIRQLIKKARKRGIPILATSKGRGYYLNYNEIEVSRFLNQEILSRIKDLFETFHALAVHVKPIDPRQMTLADIIELEGKEAPGHGK